ncbi:hypothetical protein Dimus_025442 [Dionaea muscipula]
MDFMDRSPCIIMEIKAELCLSAPEVKSNGVCGNLYAADPIDACSTLTNDVNSGGNNSSPFALIVRGGCSFEEKVRIAQEARFEAVIVYDNVDGGSLVANYKNDEESNSILIARMQFADL